VPGFLIYVLIIKVDTEQLAMKRFMYGRVLSGYIVVQI